MNKTIGFVILAFIAGMVVDRLFWGGPGHSGNEAPPERTGGGARFEDHPVASVIQDSVAKSKPAKAPSGALGDAPRKTAAGLAAKANPGLNIEFPNERPSYSPPEAEEKLNRMAHDPMTPSGNARKKDLPDGSVDLFDETADGGKLYKHYDPSDDLVKESLIYADGEGIYRTYYKNGTMKVLSWQQAGGILTSIGFSENGLFETRYDKFPDGSYISTTYNDLGQVNGIWQTDSSGKRTQLR